MNLKTAYDKVHQRMDELEAENKKLRKVYEAASHTVAGGQAHLLVDNLAKLLKAVTEYKESE